MTEKCRTWLPAVPGLVRALLLAATAALGGCATVDFSSVIDERLARHVVFTIVTPSDRAARLTSVSAVPGSDVINSTLARHGLELIDTWIIGELGVSAVVADIGERRSLDEVIRLLQSDERIESVQRVSSFDLLTYNDRLFHLQHMAINDQLEKIHSLATGKNVTVGVVDTGMDRQHPELRGRITFAANYVEHDAASFDNDEHGTAVAGVIASSANNDLGIVGVAPDVRLMAFKACWEEVGLRRARCDSISLMKALVAVLEHQPDVLNLSLAGPDDVLIRRLLQAVVARGTIVIAAAEQGFGSFPASMPEVLSVSSPLVVNATTLPAASIIAPGIDILTTSPGATYAFKSGSSMATAYVSGIAALMLERQPQATPADLRRQLALTSSSFIDALPVVDICAAVEGGRDGDVCSSSGSLGYLQPDLEHNGGPIGLPD